jgi:hypothetical protein
MSVVVTTIEDTHDKEKGNKATETSDDVDAMYLT